MLTCNRNIRCAGGYGVTIWTEYMRRKSQLGKTTKPQRGTTYVTKSLTCTRLIRILYAVYALFYPPNRPPDPPIPQL